jgi:hypothetical protein
MILLLHVDSGIVHRPPLQVHRHSQQQFYPVLSRFREYRYRQCHAPLSVTRRHHRHSVNDVSFGIMVIITSLVFSAVTTSNLLFSSTCLVQGWTLSPTIMVVTSTTSTRKHICYTTIDPCSSVHSCRRRHLLRLDSTPVVTATDDDPWADEANATDDDDDDYNNNNDNEYSTTSFADAGRSLMEAEDQQRFEQMGDFDSNPNVRYGWY